MAEPTGYENEPREQFLPVSAPTYATLYHRELAQFDNDFQFYQTALQQIDARLILECGCGTGRLLTFLQNHQFQVIGIDSCISMLAQARAVGARQLLKMDMRSLGFCQTFDAVLIPYNTLNLLQNHEAITRCLAEVHGVLNPNGRLLLHLYTPDHQARNNPSQRFFQFSMVELPDQGRLITESLRQYIPEKKTCILEHRYKIRYPNRRDFNTNHVITHELAAFSPAQWFSIIENSGFRIAECYRDFELTSPASAEEGPLLLVVHSC